MLLSTRKLKALTIALFPWKSESHESVKRPLILLVFINLLRVGIGMFFVVTSLLKIPHLDETADFLTRSRLLPAQCSLPLACIGVGMELLVGICFVSRWAYRAATLWGCGMTMVFLFLYVQGWMRGLELSCNCMGVRHTIINYPLDSVLRVLLVGAMLILVWDSRQSESGLWKFRRLDFSDM